MRNNTAFTVSSGNNAGEEPFSYLDLLARVKKALDSAREVAVLAKDIRPFPDQPRKYFNPDSIRRLSESIDAGGQTTSGMIREKQGITQYELIDGERRWRGVLLVPEARRPLYKAKLIEAKDDVVQYLISGIANFNRENHTAVEVMETIDRLVGFELPMKEIASLLGISESWAGQMHGLKNLVPGVLKMLDPTLPKPQLLPIVAAVQISKIEGQYQQGLADRVINKENSLGRLRGEVVKAAQKAGSHIRIRDISPAHQWESFGNKIEVISRTAEDTEAVIQKGELGRYIKSNTAETNELLKQLRDARETLSRISELILAARK